MVRLISVAHFCFLGSRCARLAVRPPEIAPCRGGGPVASHGTFPESLRRDFEQDTFFFYDLFTSQNLDFGTDPPQTIHHCPKTPPGSSRNPSQTLVLILYLSIQSCCIFCHFSCRNFLKHLVMCASVVSFVDVVRSERCPPFY